MAKELPSPVDIRQRREVDRAVVFLAAEEPIRGLWYWLFNLLDVWLGGPGTIAPALQIIVADKETGRIVWSNHGYQPGQNPVGAFDALCDEIDYFTLDGFLRRQSPRYWNRRPWR